MVTQDDDERKLSALPKPLSSAQILNAVESSVDGGVTIVLSKLAISDIGSNEAEELASGDRQSSGSIVERLALGHNRLNSLPPEFALFTRLRYLNLRHNSFSIFPDVLTLIPSLDTLDLSHNKIKSLPVYPGNLIRLRVFSLARNKIKRLPSYIVQFRKLELLQLDRNPLEWPPKAIIDSVDLQDPNKGKESIRSLFNWIDNELVEAKEFEDSGYGEHLEWEDEPPWEFPMLSAMSNMTRLPHSRSISMDSNTSTSSLMDSSHFTELSEHSGADHRPGGGSDYLGRFGTPSQEKGDVILDNFYTSSPVEGSQYDEPIEPEPMHTRTISHGSTLRKPQQSFVAGKKSLPDLRSTHNHTIKAISSLPDDRSPTYYMGSSTDLTFPPSRINDQPSASMSSYYSAASYSTEQQPDSVTPPFVTAERKSYFRRSSMINFNSSLPRPLVCLLDSSRSILFAMGQLYQTLENYVQQAVDERLSSIFKKVLDPANVNMLHLIRSLDRFDDVSQKSIPSPAVCRGLVECCRDTVSTFRKAVGLLVVQIGQTLADDPRYLRWLLLELYGTTAELSCAWQAMHPEIEYLKPFLYGGIFSNGFSHGLNGISDSAGPHSDESTSLIRLRPTESPFGRRTGTARRHAGSFSSKDVEIGKELPSYDIVPNMAGGLATHTPTLRTPKRQATVPVLTSTSSSSYSFNPSHSGFPAHIRHASQGSLHLDSSSTMSPPIYTEPSGSNQTIGSDALRAIQGAVDIAPSVWDQIEESFADTINTNRELKNSLNKARAITRNLSRHISNISEGTLDVDQKLLREEAHHFLKSIIQLSSTVKIQGTSHYLSPMLKSNMVKLSKLTEEFSILLHVSSIPYSTPRFSPSTSYSKFAAYNNNNSPPIEDNLLGSSLSRSRSAQPSLNGSVSSLPAVKPLSVRRPWTREASVDSSEPG